MNDIGVAIIGYGYWSPKLIRSMRANPSCRFVAICEKDESRHERIRNENPQIDVVRDYRDVFLREDVHAVVVATIPSSHFRIAKQALEMGKHVLIEKPMVLNVSEGEILADIAHSRKRTLMVDHTYLYSPAIQTLRTLIREGEVGKTYSVESIRANLGLFQRDVNVVWDLAPHDFSILLALFEEKPTHVSAVGSQTVVHPQQEKGQESIAHVVLHYASGFTAHVHVSWISPVKIRQITVIGSEGAAVYDQLASPQLIVIDQGVYPKQEMGESGPLFEYKVGDTRSLVLPTGGEDLASMFKDFVHGVQTGSLPISHAELGLDVVRLLVASEKSIQAGGKKVRVAYKAHSSSFVAIRRAYTMWRYGY
jgi:predicted dehydrogenase